MLLKRTRQKVNSWTAGLTIPIQDLQYQFYKFFAQQVAAFTFQIAHPHQHQSHPNLSPAENGTSCFLLSACPYLTQLRPKTSIWQAYPFFTLALHHQTLYTIFRNLFCIFCICGMRDMYVSESDWRRKREKRGHCGTCQEHTGEFTAVIFGL